MEQTISTRFEHLLRRRIEEEVEQLKAGLATGSAKDYADYKSRTGVIMGLGMALDFCEEVASKLSER